MTASVAIHLAREAKREKLVAAFDAYLRREEIDPNSAEAVAKIEKLDDFGWLTLSKLAGCNPPKTTRPLVVATYRNRVANVRRIGS